VPFLQPGYAITSANLNECERRQAVNVEAAPGLGRDAVPRVGDRQIAALATDTWGMEVRPNETPDTFQPLHIVFIVHMGLWVGEIFDLEPQRRAPGHRPR
jgi:hypothetical protein